MDAYFLFAGCFLCPPIFGIGQVHFHGVWGRTIAKFRKFDFDIVRRKAPDIFVLELGSNDLVKLSPQTVGSKLETLARELHEFTLHAACSCRPGPSSSDNFNCKVAKLHKYLNVVVDQLPFCYYWRHRGFWNSNNELY